MDYSHHNKVAPSLSHLLAPFAPHFIERASLLINSQYEKQQQQAVQLSVSQKKRATAADTNKLYGKQINYKYICMCFFLSFRSQSPSCCWALAAFLIAAHDV